MIKNLPGGDDAFECDFSINFHNLLPHISAHAKTLFYLAKLRNSFHILKTWFWFEKYQNYHVPCLISFIS